MIGADDMVPVRDVFQEVRLVLKMDFLQPVFDVDGNCHRTRRGEQGSGAPLIYV